MALSVVQAWLSSCCPPYYVQPEPLAVSPHVICLWPVSVSPVCLCLSFPSTCPVFVCCLLLDTCLISPSRGFREASSPRPYLLLCDCSFVCLFQGLTEPRVASNMLCSLRPALTPEPPASTSQVLGLQALTTTLSPSSSYKGCGCLLTTPGLSVLSWLQRLCRCHRCGLSRPPMLPLHFMLSLLLILPHRPV